MVNKVDRTFLELQLDPEEAFKGFQRTIEAVNVIIATYEDELLGDVAVYPYNGTVAFGSGLHGWGFTLTKFATMYASKMKGQPKEGQTMAELEAETKARMLKNLWGDHFFNPKTRKWTNTPEPGSKRGFVQFILTPIYQLFNSIMNAEKDKYVKMIDSLGVKLASDERDLELKPLLKAVMRKWLPASEALLDMIVFHLPSPVVAQKYRVENLYEGPQDDEVCIT
eukprot:TRINITY_DN7824_c0_g1_i4.p1 TRINITY_DN7824_c0_g1~~TRINITY_DN7824_c0_g1_i4.p1  ORF type:complete len:224 (-),score=49.20 TRINITY_DN7824_c0_g1_i4:309-980(-)